MASTVRVIVATPGRNPNIHCNIPPVPPGRIRGCQKTWRKIVVRSYWQIWYLDKSQGRQYWRCSPAPGGHTLSMSIDPGTGSKARTSKGSTGEGHPFPSTGVGGHLRPAEGPTMMLQVPLRIGNGPGELGPRSWPVLAGSLHWLFR